MPLIPICDLKTVSTRNLHVNLKIHFPGIPTLEVDAIDNISDVFDPGTTK